ncbi:MAG: glycosyltransferase family 2 protein [Gammaproteobacteria bacterium]
MLSNEKIAVLIPCYNEAQTIANVVNKCRGILPNARIVVCDNNSKDETSSKAFAAGAEVLLEPLQGKGHAVRRLFREVDADLYIMSDGDETYDLSKLPELLNLFKTQNLDMLIARRVHVEKEAYRMGHVLGNQFFNKLFHSVFGDAFHDIFSGFRVFSKRFVKSFPCFSEGFEIETELSVHALEMRVPVGELETPYYARPQGSQSKLRTYRDGFRILFTFLRLFKQIKPLRLFAGLGILLFLITLGFMFPIFATYLEQGIVPKFPTLIMAASMFVLSGLLVFTGLILNEISRLRLENKLLSYLRNS